jgi:hypothetical protein
LIGEFFKTALLQKKIALKILVALVYKLYPTCEPVNFYREYFERPLIEIVAI